MQKGFQNEEDFKNLINEKTINTIPFKMKELIISIFPKVSKYSRIECWRSKYLEKADIKIRIEGEIKGISIKTGHNCSIHQENTLQFNKYLEKIGIDSHVINDFNGFMLGIINGKKVCAKEYIDNNQLKIKGIRQCFNKYYNKINLIIRFIFQGTESQKYDCDAIIYGTTKNFLWATKHEVLQYLVNYKTNTSNSINISALNIKCYDRNLRNDLSKKKAEKDIQVKWYTIEEDMKNINRDRNSNSLCK